MNVLIGILIGSVTSLLLVLAVLTLGKRGKSGKASINVHGTIDEMRAIGELNVFKVVTKEIVTAKDHAFGTSGTKYFEWLLGSKKMAMIFEFDIEFSYDLKSPLFRISQPGDGSCSFSMPPCQYDLHIKDIEFYDEQSSRLLPTILPEFIGNLFSSGFGEEERNQLKDAARDQAEVLAKKMIGRLMSDVRGAAEETLKSIARSFHVDHVSFNYEQESDSPNISQVKLNEDALEMAG
jgi:hypothetical protein